MVPPVCAVPFLNTWQAEKGDNFSLSILKHKDSTFSEMSRYINDEALF
jgi:hypothetical protein